MGRFIWADLRRIWPGALVMVALVALAVALGTGVTLQERALRLGSARAASAFDLVIGAPGSETQLALSTVFLQAAALPLMPGEVLAELEADPRVAWAAPVGFGDYYGDIPLVGTTTRLVEEMVPAFAGGRMFVNQGEAVVGARVPLQIGARITPSHGAVSHGGAAHEDVAYRVVGRLQPTGTAWDRAILVPIRAVWAVHGMAGGHGHDHDAQPGHDDHDHAHADPSAPLDESWHGAETPGLPAVLVKPASIADAYKLRQEYRARPDTLAVFPAEVLTGLYGLMGDARQVLAAVAIGAQALVAVALVMVTVIHVGQRRRQVAALRAFGAPRGAIFVLVWSQMLVLLAAGILLGHAAGWLAAVQLSRLVAARQGFDLPVEWAAGDAGAFALLLGVGAVLAALPAFIAYRQPAVASLRG
ncbi:ABC transporter permease [Paracoccus sp. DMF]|uniref:ABC transporter permease n=1 Tax=Paracoccus sp. DMF TaxID=400837 RepID=UPI0021E413AC|nr:FtsX-like permease family protein [Paracoccus sp. DMF]MCV2447813.1 FtsX-like permease family protein [Paracoccus sp. DMF]